MNRQQTAQALAVLSAAFPQVTITRETAEVWHDLIGDLPADEVMPAVRELLVVHDRFPAPAHVRRTVMQRAGRLAPDPSDVWGEVMSAAREIGRHGRPDWSHPCIASTVRAIGWWEICMSDNQDAARAHFLRLYADEARRWDRAAVLPDDLAALPPADRPALMEAM